MALRDFYALLDVNFDEVIARLRREDRIVLYLEQTLSDPSFGILDDAMKRRDYETAFRAAHTIKGMSLNLVLSPLAQTASDLVECLRGGVSDEAEAVALYHQFKTRVDQTNAAAKEFL